MSKSNILDDLTRQRDIVFILARRVLHEAFWEAISILILELRDFGVADLRPISLSTDTLAEGVLRLPVVLHIDTVASLAPS